ncbi:MAG: hypothetical protein WC755_08450 [Candidatus Woesearchaeota archaeon]|jgi:hypothetical protein
MIVIETILSIVTAYIVMIDVILTHFYFYLLKKKGINDLSDEVNWLPRKLMDLMGLNGFSLIMHCTISFTLFYGIIYSVYYFFSFYLMIILISILFGASLMVNKIHFINIEFLNNVWEDDKYWEMQIERREKNKMEMKM